MQSLCCCAGTPDGLFLLAATSLFGGAIFGVILSTIEAAGSFTKAWNEGLADARAKRLAKQGVRPDDSHPAPPPGDVPPTSDI